MPYICLANSHVTDGSVQVLDLKPNMSQRSPAYDPPGQTKYVNRVQNETVHLSSATATVGNLMAEAKGLSAYLVDKVEVGGKLQAKATITTATLAANDILTISGAATVADALKVAVYKFAAGANDMTKAGTALDPFLVGLGADNAAATANLVLAINDAASIARLKVVTGTLNYVTATATAPTITTLAFANAGGAVVGQVGNTIGLVATGVAAHMVFKDLATAPNVVTRLTRVTAGGVVTEFWTPAFQVAASAALIAKVDAGTALTLATINASLLTTCGAELTNAGGSSSVGTVRELLSIMAGRSYVLPLNPFESKAVNSKFTNAFTWSATLKGSFTHSVRSFDKDKAKRSGGTIVQVEHKPIRATYDSASLQISLAVGHLKKLTGGTVVLFPDVDYPQGSTAQGKSVQAASRVVTVYADDGSVLA